MRRQNIGIFEDQSQDINLQWQDLITEFLRFVDNKRAAVRLPRDNGGQTIRLHVTEHVVELHGEVLFTVCAVVFHLCQNRHALILTLACIITIALRVGRHGRCESLLRAWTRSNGRHGGYHLLNLDRLWFIVVWWVGRRRTTLPVNDGRARSWQDRRLFSREWLMLM